MYATRITCTLYMMFWVLTSWLAVAELFSSEDVAADAESLIPVRLTHSTGTGKS